MNTTIKANNLELLAGKHTKQTHKTFYNKHDGHTYWIEKDRLMSCPTNADGTLDMNNIMDVFEDYVNPLTDKQTRCIKRGLGLTIGMPCKSHD